jgi:hypothetical protein
MDVAGFNLKRLERDHSKFYADHCSPPDFTLRANPSVGCVKFADYQHTYEKLGIQNIGHR